MIWRRFINRVMEAIGYVSKYRITIAPSFSVGAKDVPVPPQPVPEVDGVKLFPYGYKCNGCGKIAYYMKHRSVSGETLLSKGCFDLDGKQIEYFSPHECGACGKELGFPRTKNIVSLIHWSNVSDPEKW